MTRAILPIGVLVSGGGTNLQAIIDSIGRGDVPAEIRIVISDNPDAFALTRASDAGIKTAVVKRKDFPSKDIFEEEIIKQLHGAGVEMICLAGYMRILSDKFLKTFPNRIINIHPALLPSFPGLHVQQQAIDYGVKVSGCTVHFVDEGTDTGPIIIQKAVPVLPNDNAETLAARILKEEHQIYPEAIKLIAEGRIRIEGRRVHIIKN